jgi:hypothetical protein
MTEQSLSLSATSSPREVEMFEESQPATAIPRARAAEGQSGSEGIVVSEMRAALREGELLEKPQRNGRPPLTLNEKSLWRGWVPYRMPGSPSPEDETHRLSDLGVSMQAVNLFNGRRLEQLSTGNVNVAGGWACCVRMSSDAIGTPCGYEVHLYGLDAFMEAMGLEPIVGANEKLGRFAEKQDAYRELLVRLLAVLTRVSQAALDQSPHAQERMQRLELEFEELAARRLVETASIRNRTKTPGGDRA